MRRGTATGFAVPSATQHSLKYASVLEGVGVPLAPIPSLFYYYPMDSYLDLSPDSSTPHTPSPPSSHMHPDAPAHNVKIHSHVDDHHPNFDYPRPLDPAFWPQDSLPARGSYLSELYDDRMKVDAAPPIHREHAVSPNVWQHNHDSDPQYYRRASFPNVRNDHPDSLPPAPAFIHSEPGAFLGPYSSRSDAFYGEPMPIPEHVCAHTHVLAAATYSLPV